MKKIRPEQLPDILSEEIIIHLAEIASEFPKRDFHWAELSKELEKRGQLNIVLDMVDKMAREKEYQRQASMLPEEREMEKKKWNRIHENDDKDKFHGNMGEPQTAEEYKQKYGVYPLNYNKYREDGK